jgi:hypothetical protein
MKIPIFFIPFIATCQTFITWHLSILLEEAIFINQINNFAILNKILSFEKIAHLCHYFLLSFI